MDVEILSYVEKRPPCMLCVHKPFEARLGVWGNQSESSKAEAAAMDGPSEVSNGSMEGSLIASSVVNLSNFQRRFHARGACRNGAACNFSHTAAQPCRELVMHGESKCFV